LSGDALRAAQTLPNAYRGVWVLLENPGPFGVPDMLAIVGPHELLEARLALSVPPLLNQIDAGVVASAAVRAPRSVDALAARVGWPVGSVARRLPYLVRTGALEEVGTNRYVRPEALRPIGRLYAIEAKVKDWRRAVKQARRYGAWCDGYVIVMPQLGPSSSAAVTQTAADDGGGLILDGRWVRRPRIRPRPLAQRLWGSEHAIAGFFG
jgi:hypothetical protein